MSLPAGQLHPPEPALCPAHPDQLAISTCERCGTFICQGCAAGGERCPTCAARAIDALPELAGRGQKAITFLYVGIGIDVLLAFTWVVDEDLATSDAYASVVQSVEVVSALAYLATAFFFLRWLHLGVKTVTTLGRRIDVTPRGAVSCWFLPIANMVLPYRAVRSLVDAAGGEAALGRARLGLWWGLWLGGNLATFGQRQLTVANSASELVVVLSPFVLSAGAALLCMGIIRTVQDALASPATP